MIFTATRGKRMLISQAVFEALPKYSQSGGEWKLMPWGLGLGQSDSTLEILADVCSKAEGGFSQHRGYCIGWAADRIGRR
jgi:hypothetical protein